MFQTVMDNPITAYRQLVQQYAKDASGKMVDPNIAANEAKSVLYRSPIYASLSGIVPRIGGGCVKRIPKFGVLLGYSYLMGEDGDIGLGASFAASTASAYAINPIRVVEKMQRVELRKTGKEVPVMQILRECKAEGYKPLFRGTTVLMGHSFTSAALGLAGQPKLAKYIENKVTSKTTLGKTAANLIASAAVTPLYVGISNPLARIEVILQARQASASKMTVTDALKELSRDMKEFGMRGIFRGQGIGMVKGCASLRLFHFGREFCTDLFKDRNERLGLVPDQ